ncbi:lysylphosphatidylglycerol synthase transmembrane domain-containing protein [Nocardioides acrostichi]|uniref:Flippase-like domain-containing protein n=1 Tax=Nocardioides acrostichi TaxID=2784339 RepID=A0A930Y6D9_9ACTN|nr:lysylphosphatidylglycerol synthase transmembrane domain-containing protein [Nocardioides acrostichi]MBF4160836.1 flippase-like domain-containing protein [Nocardioides acrostichi]
MNRIPPSVLRRLLLVGATTTAVALAVPRLVGVPWGNVATVLTAVPAPWIVGLVLLWAAGLATHTVTLTAAMPGLSHRRAATLSLTGSFVANVLPLGGAAGIALNTRMARTWGFGPREVASYTLVTNVWDVLAKLAVASAAAALVTRAGLVLPGIGLVAGVAGALFVVSALLLLSDRCARVVATWLDVLSERLFRRWPRVPAGWGGAVLATRRTAAATAREQWAGLSGGMAGYTTLLLLLLAGCLHVTGAGVPLLGLAAGFAVERVLTLAALTPGGAGPVEVGLTAVLVASGGDPVGVVAGVLCYRLLTFALEIPVGGLWWAGWVLARRRSVPTRRSVVAAR